MEQNQINLIALERMFDDLAAKNWASSTTVFSESWCQQVAHECQSLYQDGLLSPAAIGRGSTKATDSAIRGDYTRWLDENSSSPMQIQIMANLQVILHELNKTFFLGLKRYEAHFALYPPGAGYEKHIDNHRGSGARKITFILYLNDHWQKHHGGELSFFEPDQPSQLLTQIEPRLGTFVLFRSELFPHQVEKSLQPRLSLTGWFRDDAL